MTLDEAIEHAKEVAETCGDERCAKDHERLAKWLEELKLARESMFSEIPQTARTIHENHEFAKLVRRMLAYIVDCDNHTEDECKTEIEVIRRKASKLGIEVDG